MDPTLIDTTLERVRLALEAEQLDIAIAELAQLNVVDTADALHDLSAEEKAAIVMAVDVETGADIMEAFEDDETVDVAEIIPNARLAELLDEMEPDDAADLLGDMQEADVVALLARMQQAGAVRPLLAHDDETSGGLMTPELPLLRRHWTVSQAIDYLRDLDLGDEEHYYLYVVDRFGKLLGVVGLRPLITSRPTTRVGEIMDTSVISVPLGTDQETCARLLSRYGILALPVVDDGGKLVGVITYDDLVEVLENEETEDIYALSNIGPDSDLTVWSPLRLMVRRRLPWLYINLGSAFFAAFVISQFQGLYAQVAVLAVFQSVVAALGGNAGTQALAIIVRGLALGELQFNQVRRVLVRELGIGVLHGTLIGMGVALIAGLWDGNPWLGLVIGVATLGNLIIGGLAGTLVPLTLRALKLDPALASSVLVTMITDSGGFALFLGLASLMLPLLV